MNYRVPFAILLTAGALTGCSLMGGSADKKLDYRSFEPKTGNNLEVPPDLTAPQIQNKYAIPSTGPATASAQAQAQTGQPAVATSGGVLAPVQDAHIERAGSQRWLVVDNRSPAELWPVLKAFWQDSGFVIKTEEPDLGILETDWAENRAKLPNDMLRKLLETTGLGGIYSTAERDKFRIRLEKGQNGTEVYFTHRGMAEVYVDEKKDETRWQPRPADPELEAEFLSRFMVRLGLTEEKAKAQAKAAAAPAATAPVAARARLTDGALEVSDNFDRAWRRVGLALDRVGLVVTDRDRSAGTYYVKPAENEATETGKKPGGFWSGLAFWRSDKNEAGVPKGQDLRVQVKETAPGTSRVVLTDAQGHPLQDGFGRTALSRLQTELQ